MFKARRTDNNEWITGYYAAKPLMGKHFILREEVRPYSRETVLEETEVKPDTIVQLKTIDEINL